MASVSPATPPNAHVPPRPLASPLSTPVPQPSNQAELVARLCERPRGFAWFLGAGASRAAGLPTATDLVWDLKWRHYCREENQDIDRRDLQNGAVRARVQAYFDARGFPSPWDDDEYAVYFERIFGSDRERQRNYIAAHLAEERVSLSVGNRAFGALLSAGLIRVAFTTNFDSVVEKAAAEVGRRPLPVYHLEGARAANTALDNEDFPFYCKLHGDFRYDSLKNLAPDLRNQNEELSSCLVNAANRFGFVVSGYSGRDESVMRLFHRVLDSPNPFPHGLYWTVMNGSDVPPPVRRLVDAAVSRGVAAAVVEIQTFDAFMLHLWRNIENKPAALDAKVRKSRPATVDIPLPPTAPHGPLVRLAGLPILSMPQRCQSLAFGAPKDWDELRDVMVDSKERLVLTKGDAVLAWGAGQELRAAFGPDLLSIAEAPLPVDLRSPENYHVKGFVERALALSLIRGRPLLTRTRGSATYLIANPHAPSRADLEPLSDVVGKARGTVPGLHTDPTPDRPRSEPVEWAEALRISVTYANGRPWLLLHPELWIWPPRARRDARDFMQHRRRDRYNAKHNRLLDAWLRVLLGDHRRGSPVELSPFDGGGDAENPRFLLSSRTAFARRLSG